MDDLTKCLYDFVCENRMMSVYADPKYIDVSHTIGLQTQAVRSCVDETAWEELNRLLDSMAILFCIESEHLFRATLRLAGELNRAAYPS